LITSSAIPDWCHCGGDGGICGVAVAILAHCITGDKDVYVKQHNIYKRTNVMQLCSMFICNCNIALHVLDAFCIHLQEHLEIVEAASGE